LYNEEVATAIKQEAKKPRQAEIYVEQRADARQKINIEVDLWELGETKEINAPIKIMDSEEK